ncbi:HdeD family acid-resistance protein [Natrinema ejinorense]|uniref:HdeD family acid-resistance protein n=1 Tax=Natrinema ejinorense TaxID=373386 RepID=A0A2A5QSS7_9EURY|nr:DUF308 domain-containing protein [Natrinema ejinorense]PCR89897.1 hypothetical protein CP557_04695 [Natrinema ejinorense]
MTTATMDAEQYTPQTAWRPLAFAGGIIAVIGLLAILVPFATGIALTYILGGLLLFGGVVHAGHVRSARGWRDSFWQGTLAIVSVVAAIVLLTNPVVGLLSLTLGAIAYLVLDGIAELVSSVRMGSQSGRSWIAASGVLSLVLAAFLWAGFPVSAAWFVGFIVGVSLLTTGGSMIAVANSTRRTSGDVSPATTEPRGA